MKTKNKTVYQESLDKGYSRRDFMKLAAMMTAYMGLQSSAIGQVAKALETNVRPTVIWLHFQECTGCTESFIKTSHPLVADILLDTISLDYTETLMATSGEAAETALHTSLKKNYGNYILLVEGAIPTANDGVYCVIGGRKATDILEEAAKGAQAVVTWGSCASNGGVQAAYPNPTGAKPIEKFVSGKPIIQVPGCPPIGEVMAAIITQFIVFGKVPELDGHGRPKAFYGRRVHDTCYRRPYFDAGLFVETYDDANAKKGYCLYKVGCKGPTTYNACATTKWNEGISYPIQSGHGCLGCSEAGFWDVPFYERIPNVAGAGIEATADKIGAAAAVGVAVGVTAHSVATYIRKGKIVDKHIKDGDLNN
ncbi:MAG: hydrogenase small subunit [Bacteroidota bacterium]